MNQHNMNQYDMKKDELNQDDRLQKQLEALESGTPLEQASDVEDAEMQALIKLAASIRSLPHPAMNPAPVKAQLNSFLTAARSKTRPIWHNARKPAEKGSFFNRSSLKWAMLPATAGAFLVIVFGFVALFGFATWVTGQRGAQAAVLEGVQGQVQVASAQASGAWQDVRDGDRLQSGDRLRTLEGSSATISFYEGSVAAFGPNSEVVLVRVDGERSGVLRVALIQTAGKSSHSVEKLRGDQSFYIVYTPTGTASVRGTQFNVLVDAQGDSRFAVDEGAVLVSNDESDVYLQPGQATLAQAGEALSSPTYTFSLEGPLSYKQGSTWAVSGVPLTVDEQALLSGEPQVGEQVLVEGHLQQDGSWVVDQISPAQAEGTQASFSSVVEHMRNDSLEVGSWNLLVNEDTQVERGIHKGEAVRVLFTTREDGTWVAQAVESLEGGRAGDTTSPGAVPDPNAHPILFFEPDELGSAACQNEYTVTGTLWNTADEPDDYAANVLLDYQVVQGVQFVDGVSLVPNAWETIQPGESRDFDVIVTLDPELWHNAPTGTEVELRVFVAQEANQPGNHGTRVTVTIVSTCVEQDTATPTETPLDTSTPTVTPPVTATPTATATATGTATATATVTPTTSGTPTGETDCTGANPHPVGMKLAQRYGVPYEEIMYWFCQGFGFGEIDLAYTLHLKSGQSVADIFALKSGGMGWGNIKKLLDPLGHGNGNNSKNNKNNRSNRNR